MLHYSQSLFILLPSFVHLSIHNTGCPYIKDQYLKTIDFRRISRMYLKLLKKN